METTSVQIEKNVKNVNAIFHNHLILQILQDAQIASPTWTSSNAQIASATWTTSNTQIPSATALPPRVLNKDYYLMFI